nr:hypothetical protein [Salmonella sp.]
MTAQTPLAAGGKCKHNFHSPTADGAKKLKSNDEHCISVLLNKRSVTHVVARLGEMFLWHGYAGAI